MQSGISRICGCEGPEVKAPEAEDEVFYIASGCEHGFSAWDAIGSLIGEVSVTFRSATSNLILQVMNTARVRNDPRWIPHRNTFLFSDRLGTITGFQVVSPERIDVVWDPCPHWDQHYHGRMEALEWVTSQIVGKGPDDGTPVVIPLF